MEENKKNEKGVWWQQGVALFTEVSSWIIGPIILALIFGKMLDNHFGTKPWIFLGLTALSFCISCFGIFRIIRKYIKNIQDLGNIEKEKKED